MPAKHTHRLPCRVRPGRKRRAADAAKKGNGVVVKDSKDKGRCTPLTSTSAATSGNSRPRSAARTWSSQSNSRARRRPRSTPSCASTPRGSRCPTPSTCSAKVACCSTRWDTYTPDAAKTSLKKGKTAQQWDVAAEEDRQSRRRSASRRRPAVKGGGHRPGSNYFDDTGWDGTIGTSTRTSGRGFRQRADRPRHPRTGTSAARKRFSMLAAGACP